MKMTKEEREAARARCEAAYVPTSWSGVVAINKEQVKQITGHDLPRALDTIDALEAENAHLHRQVGIIEDLKTWLYERGSAMMSDGALEELKEMIVTYDCTHEEAISYSQKFKQDEEEEGQ